MSKQNLTKPKTPLHPRDPQSPVHKKWQRTIGQAVRRARARRRKDGLMSVRDLVLKGPFNARVINQAMDRGELQFVSMGKRRVVFLSEYQRFLRVKMGNAA